MNEDTYVDPYGTTWLRPTAEAYALTCHALNRKNAEAKEQRELCSIKIGMAKGLYEKEKARADTLEAEVNRLSREKYGISQLPEILAIIRRAETAEAKAKAMEITKAAQDLLDGKFGCVDRLRRCIASQSEVHKRDRT